MSRTRRRTIPRCTLIATLACALAACNDRAAPDPAVPVHTPPAATPPQPQHHPTPRTTDSGLTITDLTIGAGEPCPAGATITMNFTARLAGGDIYDSSDLRKRSWTIDLANPNVIPGLREGIPGMRPGATRKLEIPWALAYGQHGRDPIPPKTDLVWEIQLLDWKPGQPATPDAD